MHWPRMGIVVGVIGLVLLGAGWWLSGVGSSRPREHLLAAAAVRPPRALLRSLEHYLSLSTRRPAPSGGRVTPGPTLRRPLRRDIRPNVTVCPVAAGGSCSLKPCVVYAGSVSAVVLRAVPAPAHGPSGSTCQGRPAPPRTLLVGG